MNVDHVLLGRGLSSINYASLYLRRSHLNLTDLNLTVASPTAKPPNLIDRQYFRLYGIAPSHDDHFLLQEMPKSIISLLGRILSPVAANKKFTLCLRSTVSHKIL